jgi:hypothetical protein
MGRRGISGVFNKQNRFNLPKMRTMRHTSMPRKSETDDLKPINRTARRAIASDKKRK